MRVRVSRRLFASVIALSLSVFLGQSAYGDGGGGVGGAISSTPSAPKYDPVVEYQKGLEALKANDNKAAEKAFKRVLKVARKDANSNYLLGLALMNQEKYKMARKRFEKAVKYDENNVLARGYLAKAYALTDKYKKSEKQISKLKELQAVCGDCESAQSIERALEISMQSAQTQGDTGLIEKRQVGVQKYLAAVNKINKSNYQAALAELSDSAIVTGPHPDILTYQGFANRKLGNHQAALRFYKSALAIDKNHRGANEYLGEYFVEIGRLDLAKSQLKRLNRICAFGCEEAEELERWINAAKL